MIFFDKLDELKSQYGIRFYYDFDDNGQLIYYTGLKCISCDEGSNNYYITMQTDDDDDESYTESTDEDITDEDIVDEDITDEDIIRTNLGLTDEEQVFFLYSDKPI
jgi:hypothetical protein